jgi:hypothetical protein
MSANTDVERTEGSVRSLQCESSFNNCGEPGIKRGLTQPVFMN